MRPRNEQAVFIPIHPQRAALWFASPLWRGRQAVVATAVASWRSQTRARAKLTACAFGRPSLPAPVTPEVPVRRRGRQWRHRWAVSSPPLARCGAYKKFQPAEQCLLLQLSSPTHVYTDLHVHHKKVTQRLCHALPL